jgi:hypothetical protein
MNRLIIPSLAAALAMAAAAPGANAQGFSPNPFQIGGSAGIAFPTGDLGTIANTGYNVTLIGGYKPLFLPVGIRVEAAYNEFGLEGIDGNVNIPAFTGNLVYELPSVSFRPYVIGGGGLYRTNVDVAGGGTAGENNLGFNIGGGIKLPLSTSFETFVEARYNHVAADGENYTFIPITVGILW